MLREKERAEGKREKGQRGRGGRRKEKTDKILKKRGGRCHEEFQDIRELGVNSPKNKW